MGIVRAVRALRRDVPVLVRTQDDAGLAELIEAGATEVVPETFETSLMLVSQVLMLLKVPVSRVVRTVGEIRRDRYATLRSVVHREGEGGALDDWRESGEGYCVRGAAAGGLGHRPQSRRRAWPRGGKWPSRLSDARASRDASLPATRCFARGDIVVIYGTPDAIEHAEAVFLTG